MNLQEHMVDVLMSYTGQIWSESYIKGIAALTAAAAQEHYRPVIETVEQLDALPDDTVVAVGDGCPARKGMGDWYFANDDGDGYPSQSLRLHLPITVLWTPGAGE